MAVKINGTTVLNDSRNFTSDTVSIQGTNLVATQKFKVASGTTAQRPSSPGTGDLFFDTDEGTLISFNGTDWA
tara:strand:- start:7028 stop:7246 length:219 start_codon:yes stop_codon:yes gene_type:complete